MKNDEIFWPPKARNKHLYVPGMPGSGKSTLMFWLALNDLEHGRSLAVIDPKNDLVAAPLDPDSPNDYPGLIHYIPPDRVDDCIFISPSHPIPIDLMSWDPTNLRELEDTVNDLVAIFHRLDPSWGIQIGALLDYSLYTLLLARSRNFLDINKILSDEKWREKLLLTIPMNNHIAQATFNFWRNDFPKMEKASSYRITVNRMSKFLLSPFIHAVLEPTPNALNIQDAIENNKILLISLGVVKSETDTANLVGSMIISKIQQALFRRERIPKSQRKPFALYVDEFQNVKSSAFIELLSKARGFNLSACLANQHPGQIKDYWDDIMGCVKSYILFQMDGNHAQKFKGKIKEPPLPDDSHERFLESRERKKKIQELKSDISDVKRQMAALDKVDDLEIVEWSRRLSNGERIIAERQKEIDALEEQEFFRQKERTQTPPTFIDQIPFLDPGKAFYVATDGTALRIRTYGPPEPPEESHADEIIEATRAKYGPKRTLDTPSGNGTRAVEQSKKDGATSTNKETPTNLLPDKP